MSTIDINNIEVGTVVVSMSATDAQCGCDRCTCTDPSDLTLAGVPLCGCCAADCPDVHGAAASKHKT